MQLRPVPARALVAVAILAAGLSYPALSSASDDAAVQETRKELVSQRSETSQTFQNPDGSLTTEVSTQPARFKDAAGKWSKIDTTLVKRDGHYEPKSASVDMSFSAGGDDQFVDLARDGGDSFALGWPSTLPTPEVTGNVLTYRDVVPHGDLVVTALPTGFSHSVVLRRAPADPSMTIPIPIDLEGTTLKKTRGGGLAVASSDDAAVSAPAPVMWDDSTGAFGLPDNVKPVDAAVEGTARNTTLTLSPDAGMLADPQTKYPVTIDPTFTQTTPTSDTFINSAGSYTSSNTVKAWDFMGTGYSTDGPGINARSFLKFPNFDYTNKTVTSAELQVRNVKSNVCTNAATIAERITGNWSESTLTWANQPGVDTSYAPPQYYLSHGGPAGGNCTAHDWGRWNVTKAVQAWSGGSPNYGLRLRAATENWTNAYRQWRAQEGVTAGTGTTYYPKLAITYSLRPGTPTSLVSSPCTDCTTPPILIESTEPAFSAGVHDPENDALRVDFELWNGHATTPTVRSRFASTSAKSGSTAKWLVQNISGGAYSWRVRSWDGKGFGAWSAWQRVVLPPNEALADDGTVEADPSETDGQATPDFMAIESATSPRTLRFPIKVPAGQSLRLSATGVPQLVDGQNRVLSWFEGVAVPPAASEEETPELNYTSSFVIDGNTIVQTVQVPDGSGFPISVAPVNTIGEAP